MPTGELNIGRLGFTHTHTHTCTVCHYNGMLFNTLWTPELLTAGGLTWMDRRITRLGTKNIYQCFEGFIQDTSVPLGIITSGLKINSNLRYNQYECSMSAAAQSSETPPSQSKCPIYYLSHGDRHAKGNWGSEMPYFLPAWEANNSHTTNTIRLNTYTHIHYYSIYVQHEACIPTT